MNVMEDLIHNLRIAHNKILDSADELQDNAVRVEAESLAEEIKTLYRSMTERMKTIKRSPGAGTQRNRSQIDKVQRHLGAAIQSYHEVELEFRQGMEEQMVRSYRIVNPDATDEELQAAMANPDDQQIFAKAVSVIASSMHLYATPSDVRMTTDDANRSKGRSHPGIFSCPAASTRHPADRAGCIPS